MQEMVSSTGKVTVVVHLAVGSDDGRETIACASDLRHLGTTATQHSPWLRSNDLRAVTCPLCRMAAQVSRELPSGSPAYQGPPRLVTVAEIP